MESEIYSQITVSVLYSAFFVLFVLCSYCIMYPNVRLSHNKKITYLLTYHNCATSTLKESRKRR